MHTSSLIKLTCLLLFLVSHSLQLNIRSWDPEDNSTETNANASAIALTIPIPTNNHSISDNPLNQPFSLRNWTLQLPIGYNNSFRTVKNPNLSIPGYSNDFFYLNKLGDAWTFHTPVLPKDGVHSSGSLFTRTELREMNSTHDIKDNAAWDTVVGVHYMKVTQSIDAVSSPVEGKLISFQIHSFCCAVMTVRILAYYEDGDKYLLFADFDRFEEGSLTKIIGADRYDLDRDYKLGTKFDLEVVVDNGLVYVYFNGFLKSPPQGYRTYLLAVYYKVGSYSQNVPSETIPGSAVNEVSIYKLEIYHGNQTYTHPTPSIPDYSHNNKNSAKRNIWHLFIPSLILIFFLHLC
ncbi:hypothetical protein HK099_006552 [Clydaea vesicula]|uniref:Alginate lyase 2 domain-containing protein n=1 Tax=Clydaea vesicula TaxID=447962 RepID=A0AAD5TYQ5_9FUNG|nr:hypothetical protein HK099_006552 [Clydaea vesicula]